MGTNMCTNIYYYCNYCEHIKSLLSEYNNILYSYIILLSLGNHYNFRTKKT